MTCHLTVVGESVSLNDPGAPVESLMTNRSKDPGLHLEPGLGWSLPTGPTLLWVLHLQRVTWGSGTGASTT
ncbi:hypothetical protein WMY93_034151 [Mugilogobius chulae]|uniref:Uncharacterized protein n=1 Tax=Mugilogobius chulae TaxID=88201 RepID=A0AAW0MQJ7_9GOBI